MLAVGGYLMSKFYFHIVIGESIIADDEVMELSGLLAARAEAIASARDLAWAGSDGQARIVQIVDAFGTVLGWVPVVKH